MHELLCTILKYMCVIIYKPAGKELPDNDILDRAHKRNPHGCGLVSPSVFYKGLSYAAFKKHLKECTKEEPLLIHFRFATHGSVKKSNCHPFYDDETGTYFMHNGVVGGVNPLDDTTDSECVFRQILQPFIRKYGYGSIEAMNVARYLSGRYSKFAMLNNRDVILIGDYILYRGCYYSNLRFLAQSENCAKIKSVTF